MNEFEYDRLGDYLEHIVQAIERIDSYVEDMAEQAFTLDHRTQDAVIRNFEIIGEACNNVLKNFPDYAESHHEIPWRFAYDMRKVLASLFMDTSRSIWKFSGAPSIEIYLLSMNKFELCCPLRNNHRIAID